MTLLTLLTLSADSAGNFLQSQTGGTVVCCVVLVHSSSSGPVIDSETAVSAVSL